MVGGRVRVRPRWLDGSVHFLRLLVCYYRYACDRVLILAKNYLTLKFK